MEAALADLFLKLHDLGLPPCPCFTSKQGTEPKQVCAYYISYHFIRTYLFQVREFIAALIFLSWQVPIKAILLGDDKITMKVPYNRRCSPPW